LGPALQFISNRGVLHIRHSMMAQFSPIFYQIELSQMSHYQGLNKAGAHQSPAPHLWFGLHRLW